MIDRSSTTTVLLEGLRDPADAQVWEMFDRRYRPIVLGFASAAGLSDADAADVAQEAMTQFLQEYRAGRYDRTRGRLRTWLIAITKTRIALHRRAQARTRQWRGDSALIDLADHNRLDAIWEEQRRRHLLREALRELREQSRFADRTIEAFELLVLRGQSVQTVAGQLDISAHDVYLAKSRVTARLREILSSLEERFDDGAGSDPGGATMATTCI
jgi:RNA polymerase sigma-70 factor, ECF subfamily